MDPDEDLTVLLERGEQATFHGRPAEAIALLEQAVVLAQSTDQGPVLNRVAWLLGVALAAAGRYGAALTVLSPLADSGSDEEAPEDSVVYAALASASIAGVHRQLGRHLVAQQADLTALAFGEGDDRATAMALLGLAADAVGLRDVDQAGLRLAEALTFLPPDAATGTGASAEEAADRGDGVWRPWVRVGWLRAEIALLQGRNQDGVLAVTAAVERAERAEASRHVAKGLLLLGVARLQVLQAEPTEPARAAAVEALHRAATLAEELGAVPLIWPTRALLGALNSQVDSAQAGSDLAAARAAVLAIAGDLPPGVRAEWLARPDIAALLAS